MKLKIRCPSCDKLYEVQSDDIHSATPLFQCISCNGRFSFEYPPQDESQIVCFAVDVPPAAAQRQEATRSCPKCGALNGRRSKECYSCHVLFDRLEGLPSDPSLRAQPSLVRKWKILVENFDDENLHNEFIHSCHELDALRFASLKYEELKAAQGGDPQCDRMLAKINSLMMIGLSQKPLADETKTKSRPKWEKFMYWSPFVLSSGLILLGMVNLGHRNLIGVGVALSFMTSGLIVMVRGKMSLSDFLD